VHAAGRQQSGFVWTAPGLVGGVVISPDTEVDTGTAQITAHRAQNCKGKFGVIKLPVTAAGASIKTLCETSPGKAIGETYLLLPRSAGGVFLFTIFEVDDGAATAPDNAPGASAQTAGADSEATSARLMDASIRVLGR
jgi:hypothetical protein